MNSKKESIADLENLLSELRNVTLSLNGKLGEIEFEISDLMKEIEESPSIQQANAFFDALQKYQHILAKILYKSDIQLSKRLRDFVIDFDRLDDNNLREFIYPKIKEREYVW